MENKVVELEKRLEALNTNLKDVEKKIKRNAIWAITNTCIAFCGHMIGAMIHPLVVAGSLTYLLLSVAPAGIVNLWVYEPLEEKYKKAIDETQKELAQLTAAPAQEATLESVPVVEQTKTQENIQVKGKAKSNTKKQGR
jgi:hypothetical protein